MGLMLAEYTSDLKRKMRQDNLMPYFYDGKAITKDDDNYDKVIEMAQYCCGYLSIFLRDFRTIMVRKEDDPIGVDFITIELSDERMLPHKTHVKHVYNDSPAIQLYLKSHPENYPDLIEAINTAPLEDEVYQHKRSIDQGHYF